MKGSPLGAVLIAIVAIAACDRSPDDSTPPSEAPQTTAPAGPTSASADPPGRTDFDPPPARLGYPARVLDLRLRGEPVGTYRDSQYPGGVPLQAIGANLCQTGWVVQGFLRPEGGTLVATPPFHLPVANLPVGKAYQHRDPDAPGRELAIDLERSGAERLAGSLSVRADDSPEPILEMTFDGAPVGIATGPGLGGRGCFTTGYWDLEVGGEQKKGPVTAVWDEEATYYVGARLNDEFGIGLWLVLRPTHRQPQNVIRADLARVQEKPRLFPMRVVFERRVPDDDGGMRVEETPATSGELVAAFQRANPQGPLRVQLDNLVFPAWEGPLSGRTVSLQIETLFVTDPLGSAVPIPSAPTFKKQTERPSQDAPSGVTPGATADQK